MLEKDFIKHGIYKFCTISENIYLEMDRELYSNLHELDGFDSQWGMKSWVNGKKVIVSELLLAELFNRTFHMLLSKRMVETS